MISDFKNIKEIHDNIYESQFPTKPKKQSMEINNNLNLNKIGNNIYTKKLPELHQFKNTIDFNFLNNPPRNQLITPLLQNKNNYTRKKSEIFT